MTTNAQDRLIRSRRIINVLRVLASAACVICAGWGSQAVAAQISVSPEGELVISGSFEEGDYVRTFQAIKELYSSTDKPSFFAKRRVVLASPGGNALEAAKLSEFIYNTFATVRVNGPCMSSCFWLVAAAAKREIAGPEMASSPLGVHNVYMPASQRTSDMKPKALVEMHKSTNDLARQIMLRFEVPSVIIDRMVSTAGSEIYILSQEDRLLLGQFRPSITQVRETKCKADTRMDRLRWRADITGLESDAKAYGAYVSSVDPVKLENVVKDVESCFHLAFRFDAIAWVTDQIALSVPWPAYDRNGEREQVQAQPAAEQPAERPPTRSRRRTSQ